MRPRARGKENSPFGFGDANIDGFMRFQRNFLLRVSEYFDSVSDLAATGSVDPGAWIRDYAAFWSGVVEDVGDWTLESERDIRPWREWLVVFKSRVPEGANGSVRIDVPLEAFAEKDTPATTLTLVTDGLATRGGGKFLAFPQYVRLDPEDVTRLHRRTHLRMFDVQGVVRAGQIYRGLIWTRDVPLMAVRKPVKKTNGIPRATTIETPRDIPCPVAAVEIEILPKRP
jgi:hypothetical protein